MAVLLDYTPWPQPTAKVLFRRIALVYYQHRVKIAAAAVNYTKRQSPN
jgi:hypothetical protein